MLRQTKYIGTYPNKTVFEDLITRTGPATYDSFSPFYGQAEEVARQFVGSAKGRYKQAEFIKYTLYAYKDFNPSAVKEVKKFGTLEEESSTGGTYRTLEDLIIDGVEHEKVREHVTNMVVGYRKNAKSPYVEGYETYTYTKRNLDGDDDDEIEEKFLKVKEHEAMSNDDFDNLVRELPYTMKSIWNYSKMYKANLFSFIFAYMAIKDKNRKRADISVTDFRDYPTFLIKSDGTYERNFVHAKDNKYVIYPEVTKIFIYSNTHQAEFNLCVKFMDTLKMLGIDYRDEDPYEYTNEFIDSIVCPYLPDNEQYFSDYRDLDVEIMVALKPENIFNTAKSNMYASVFQKETEFDFSKAAYFATERIKLAYSMGEIDDDFLDDRSEEAMAFLNRWASAMNKTPSVVPEHLVSFEANGLLYFKKSLLSIPGSCLGTYNMNYDYYVALTKYGFLILLEEEYDEVYYLYYSDCYEALKEFESYGKVQSEAHWKRLGVDY